MRVAAAAAAVVAAGGGVTVFFVARPGRSEPRTVANALFWGGFLGGEGQDVFEIFDELHRPGVVVQGALAGEGDQGGFVVAVFVQQVGHDGVVRLQLMLVGDGRHAGRPSFAPTQPQFNACDVSPPRWCANVVLHVRRRRTAALVATACRWVFFHKDQIHHEFLPVIPAPRRHPGHHGNVYLVRIQPQRARGQKPRVEGVLQKRRRDEGTKGRREQRNVEVVLRCYEILRDVTRDYERLREITRDYERLRDGIDVARDDEIVHSEVPVLFALT